jgi:hypothetical protein
LRLVGDEHGSHQRAIDVGLPAVAQDLRTRPPIVRRELYAKQVTELAIKSATPVFGRIITPILISRSALKRSTSKRSTTDLPIPGTPVMSAKPPSRTRFSTRQQKLSTRGVTSRASTGMSGETDST